jgi:Leucine-rich repeat (LRR) protein
LNLDEVLADKTNRDYEAGEEEEVDATKANDKRVGMTRKKKCGIFAVVFLLVGGAVGASLGVTLGKNSDGSEKNASNGNDGDSSSTLSPGYSPTFQSGSKAPTPNGKEYVVKENAAMAVLKLNLPEESYNAVADPDIATPQNAALNWVLYDDTFEYDWDGLAQDPPDSDAEFNFMQRYVAVTLYTVLDGDNWENNTNWKTDANVCKWHGIKCYGDVAEEEAGRRRMQQQQQQQTSENAIHSLLLSNNKLRGWLPADLSTLTSLVDLEMHKNKIIGQLPPHLYDMKTLRTIFMDDNKLTGTIATEIGQLKKLEKFTLNENEISGSVPTEIGGLENLSL